MKNAKPFIFMALILALNSKPGRAQTSFGMGLNINQTLSSYGMGMNITTPLISKSFRFRLSANIMGLQGIPITQNEKRNVILGYGLFRLGVTGKGITLGEKSRVYYEGGPLLMLNNAGISIKKINIGGYGVFGMEYNMFSKAWVFLEGGGVGTGAKADKLEGSPLYSTGLFFGMGLRVYF